MKRRIAQVSADQYPLVTAQRTVDLDRIAETLGRLFIWSDELNEVQEDNVTTDQILSGKTDELDGFDDIPKLELTTHDHSDDPEEFNLEEIW